MSWKSADTWRLLKDGIDCPMCSEDVLSDETPFSFRVTETPTSVVRFCRNQYHRGWTVVILKRHACELHELTESELAGFWTDVALTGKALDAVFQPVKLNYCVFGHLVPHIHCHLLLRFPEDDPNAPVDLRDGERLLSDDYYQSTVAALRKAMGVDTTSGD